MSTVPSDVAGDMLLRVPVKSLARFRLVSKTWQNIIDHILSKQSSLVTNTRILLWPFSGGTISDDESVQLVNHETLIKSRDAAGATNHVPMTEICRECGSNESQGYAIRVVGSCNGLICLVTSSNNIIFWNPLTRVYKKIARFDKTSDTHYCPYFGYDVSTGDYKVVVVENLLRYSRRYKVYSLKYRTWRTLNSREIPRYFYCFRSLELSTQTLLNGSLHWIVRKEMDRAEAAGPTYTTVILAFDLAEEKFWEIRLPDLLTWNNNRCFNCFPHVSLAILDGQLCLFGRDRERIDNINDTELWIMKEYSLKESWVPWISVTNVPVFRPLCMSREKKIVALVDENELVTYDPIKRKLEKMKSPESVGAFGIVYEESLISPKLLGSSSSLQAKRRKIE